MQMSISLNMLKIPPWRLSAKTHNVLRSYWSCIISHHTSWPNGDIFGQRWRTFNGKKSVKEFYICKSFAVKWAWNIWFVSSFAALFWFIMSTLHFFLIFVSYLTLWGAGGSSGLWNYTLASCLGWVGGSALGSEQHRLVILMIQIL